MGMLRAAWQSCLRSIPRRTWVSEFSQSSTDCSVQVAELSALQNLLDAEAPQKVGKIPKLHSEFSR